jgi:hypothetical protein
MSEFSRSRALLCVCFFVCTYKQKKTENILELVKKPVKTWIFCDFS